MATIIYQTDEWGNIKGEHHIEFKVRGRAIMIDVTDDHVHVFDEAAFPHVDQTCVNSAYFLLHGGRFSNMDQYREYSESGKLPVIEPPLGAGPLEPDDD